MPQIEVHQAAEDPAGWCRIAVTELPWSPADGIELSFRRPSDATPYLAEAGWQAAVAWLRLEVIELGATAATLLLGPPHTSWLSRLWAVEIGLRPAGGDAPAVSKRIKWPRMTLAAEGNPVGQPVSPPPPPSPPPPSPPPSPSEPSETSVLRPEEPLPTSAEDTRTGRGRRSWLWALIAAVVAVVLLMPAYQYFERAPETPPTPAPQEKAQGQVQPPSPATTPATPPAPVPTQSGQAERKFNEDELRAFLGTNPSGAKSAAEAQLYRDQGHPDLALLLYRDADRKGDPGAAKAIARMYDPATYDKATSPFPAPDADQAASYYEKAATAGDVEAQLALGRLFIQGKTSGPSDIERGVVWLERAAKAGSAEAAKLLEQSKGKPAGGN